MFELIIKGCWCDGDADAGAGGDAGAPVSSRQEPLATGVKISNCSLHFVASRVMVVAGVKIYLLCHISCFRAVLVVEWIRLLAGVKVWTSRVQERRHLNRWVGMARPTLGFKFYFTNTLAHWHKPIGQIFVSLCTKYDGELRGDEMIFQYIRAPAKYLHPG